MTREEILTRISLAYSDTFFGYKGGEFTYDDYTNIHFEEDSGSYTDGDYASRWIAKIEDKEKYSDQEDRLVKIAFQ